MGVMIHVHPPCWRSELAAVLHLGECQLERDAHTVEGWRFCRQALELACLLRCKLQALPIWAHITWVMALCNRRRQS